MTDHPLLFRAEMVRALLEGRKSQTRRPAWRVVAEHEVPGQPSLLTSTAAQRIADGDRIWMKESFRFGVGYDRKPPRAGSAALTTVWYEATGEPSPVLGTPISAAGKLRPSIHMPRWASRLTLIVTGARIERLQDISEDDASAEGMFHFAPMKEFAGKSLGWTYQNGAPAKHLCDTARNAFALFYCLIHGEAAWDANPEVVVLTFTVHKANIGALRLAA